MSSRRPASLILLTAALALVLSACTGGKATQNPAPGQQPAGNDKPSTPPAAAAGGPKKGGTLNFVIDAEPKTLNPYRYTLGVENAVWRQIFDTVTFLDPVSLEPKPGLSEKWETSPDGKAYTLYFRKGVKFHNGQEMTADDVLYSIGEAQKGSLHPVLKYLQNVEKAEAKDATTVVLTLKTKDNLFMTDMTNFPIIPKGTEPQQAQSPIGTGPFKFARWEQGSNIAMEANKDYWQKGQPYLDKLVARIVPDQQTQMLQLMSGQVDAVAAQPAYFDQIKKDANLQLVTVDAPQLTAVFYLMLNANKAPFDNPKVRQAFNYALDRDRMAQALPGLFVPQSSIVSAKAEYYNSDAPNYCPRNLEKAKQLMKEAGVGEISFVMDVHGPDRYITVAEIIQQNLKEIGMNVEVRQHDISAWVDKTLNKHDYTAALSALGVNPNPWDVVQNSFGLGRAPATGMDKLVPNWEQLVGEARTLDHDAYTKRLKELQNLALTTNTTIHVGGINRVNAFTKRVKGVPPHPQGLMLFGSAWLDQ
jgi:peptide/nickel transport system substrate-binding protein